MKKKFLGLVALCISFFTSTSATTNNSPKTSTPNDATINLTSVGGYYTKDGEKIQFVAFGAEMIGSTEYDYTFGYTLNVYADDSCSGTVAYCGLASKDSHAEVFKKVFQAGRFYVVFDESSANFEKNKTYYGKASCALLLGSINSNITYATGNYDKEYEI